MEDGAGVEHPAKIKLDSNEEIEARIDFLAGKTELSITATGVTRSNPTIASAESRSVDKATTANPSLKNMMGAALHAETAYPDIN